MASQHSYLPSIEAVCPESTTSSPSPRLLPVISLPIVLVPGVKLPLRISNSSLATYLRSEIHKNNGAVRIGILYQADDDDDDVPPLWSRRGSGPQDLSRFSEQLILQIGDGFPAHADDGNYQYEPAEDTTSTTNDEDGDPPNNNDVDDRRGTSNAPTRRIRSEKGMGQIGTVATVLFQHRNDDGPQQQQESPRRGSMELVLTAIGTTRFCVLGQAQEEPVRMHHIQEILDEPLRKRPPSNRIATTSLLPNHIVQEPWRLAEELHQHYQNQDPPKEPVALSFWCIQHLLHTPAEQNTMLQYISVTERLRALRAQLVAAAGPASTETTTLTSTALCCRGCHHPLAKTPQDIITVPGADGTSGNYVNAHGVVHSTITIRALPDVLLRTMSAPETHDSWFPGYSWTIIACRWCGNHLGWRFHKVMDSLELDSFVGLTSSSIVTESTRS